MGLAQLLFGAGGKDVYGSKPAVPDRISYGPALKDILQTNREILPDLTQLGLMSTDALNQLIERLMPGATKLRDTITGGYQDMAEGKIPLDVQKNLRRYNAELGIDQGTSGSQFQLGNLAETYGKTSLALASEGRREGGAWFSNLSSRAYDPTKGMLNPEDAVRLTEFNWNRDWLAAQVDASPSPTARGKREDEMAVFGMMAGAYAGGPGYQGRQKPTNGGSGPGSGAGGGEEGAMGGRSYFGETGSQGYTPTNYNYSPSDYGADNFTTDDFWGGGGA